jgi:hypothetical protein
MLILLRTTSSAFWGVFGDKDNCPHVCRLAIFVRVYWRGQKRCVRISVLIATSWGRRTNMGWNTLGSYGNPLTPQVVIPISREFELPKRCVDTHIHLALLQMVPHIAELLSHLCERFAGFIGPRTGEKTIVEVFPQFSMLLEIDEHGSFLAFVIHNELNTFHLLAILLKCYKG